MEAGNGREGMGVTSAPHTNDGRLRHRKLRLALQGTAAVLWALSAILAWSSGERGRVIYLTAMALSATGIAVWLARASDADG